MTAARVRARARARDRRPVDRPAREGSRFILSPPVLSATIVINLLSLALPVVLLQIYDRVIPNQSVDTLAPRLAEKLPGIEPVSRSTVFGRAAIGRG